MKWIWNPKRTVPISVKISGQPNPPESGSVMTKTPLRERIAPIQRAGVSRWWRKYQPMTGTVTIVRLVMKATVADEPSRRAAAWSAIPMTPGMETMNESRNARRVNARHTRGRKIVRRTVARAKRSVRKRSPASQVSRPAAFPIAAWPIFMEKKVEPQMTVVARSHSVARRSTCMARTIVTKKSRVQSQSSRVGAGSWKLEAGSSPKV